MENQERRRGGLSDHIPMRYSPEEVEGRLTPEQLQRLNRLVIEFPSFADGDRRLEEWYSLDQKAQGK